VIHPPRARWFRFIASPRLAAWLIVVMGVLAFLGILIPQRSLLTADMMADFQASAPVLAELLKTLGLDALFSGWPVITVTGLLAMSTIACTWVRLDRYIQGVSTGAAPEVSRVSVPKADWDDDRGSVLLAHVRDELHAAGWGTVEAPGRVVGVRGRHGFLGSLLLHVSLLIIMVGGSATALTDFSGTMVLAEGQSVVDEADSYLVVDSEPRIGESYAGARVTMDSMRFAYQDGQLVGAIATMSGLDTAARRVSAEARVNHPFTLAGKSYLVQNSGLVADITLTIDGASNGVLVNLVEETPIGWADEITLPGTVTEQTSIEALSLLVSPIPLAAGQELPAERYLIDEPRLGLRTLTSETVGDLHVLAPGDSAEIAPEAILTFNGVRYWTKFLVRQDSARWVVYLGFWLGVIGIVWRFLWPERRLSVSLMPTDGEIVHVRLGYRLRPWRGIVAPGDQALLDKLAVSVDAGDIQEEGS
jgi:cytochrome c biogenesis protein ResB